MSSTSASPAAPDRPWAVVPVKSPLHAKTRLATLLDAEERARLVEHMLADVLAALGDSTSLAGVLVVTPDPRVAAFARARGVEALEELEPGLNRAIEQAREHLGGLGVTRLLVIPADLPLLTGAAVDRLVASAPAGEASVVLAPDATRSGTNALLRTPSDVVAPAFGPGSFQLHGEASRAAGARLVVVSLPELEIDLDEPPDLESVLARGEEVGAACRTIPYLRGLGVEERLRSARTTIEEP